MSLCWLTIAQIEQGVTRLNFSAFGGMKEEIRNPAVRRGGRVNCKE
jgi:hypothetical protein